MRNTFIVIFLCAAGFLAAQSDFDRFKKTRSAYNEKLNTLLKNNDVAGMKSYLAGNPGAANDASSSVQEQREYSTATVHVPLLYDVVAGCLNGSYPADMCGAVLAAGGNLNVAFGDKTPVYLVLDYIAVHPKDLCATAEQLLSFFTARSDFDVNYRHRSLLPPLAYLIRENYRFLGRFDKNYVSDNALKLLLDKGAPINTYDSDGNTLMSFAMDTDNEYLQGLFIEKGIDLTKKNSGGNDALYKAIAEGRTELVKQIENSGYNIHLHNLKNDPKSFKQHTEIYHYVATLCADKATSYDDLLLFRKMFADKFDLIKSKLNQQYYERVKPVDNGCQSIIALIKANNLNSKSQTENYAQAANTFLINNREYDPDGKLKSAQQIIDCNDVLEVYNGATVTWQVQNTYLEYKQTSEFVKIITLGMAADQASWHSFQSHTDYVIERSNKSLRAVNRLVAEKTFGDAGEIYFSAAQDKIVFNSNRLAQVIAQDNRILAQEEEERRRQYQEYQRAKCVQCEIDRENKKNKLPESKHFDSFLDEVLFSYDKPGIFYMKNGDKYEFYQTSDFSWKVSTGWFSSKTFKTFKEMFLFFEKDCEEKYCK